MANKDSFSWRSVPNVLGRVYRQPSYTCWAVTGRDAITSHYQACHMGKTPFALLSFQEILNCVKRWDGAEDEHTTLREKFEAYQTVKVFQYARARGLVLSDDYKFVRDNVICSPPSHATRFFVMGYTDCTPNYCLSPDEVQEQEQMVKEALSNFPLIGLFTVYNPSFEDYFADNPTGVYKGRSAPDEVYVGDHAVQITGMNIADDGTAYYEFKDTSGVKFADQGFGKIKRDLIFQIFHLTGVEKVEKDKDGIDHKYIQVDGVQLHIAEIGEGSNIILFCHGFPEMWFSWRHQMIALAQHGFRAIAADYRGYGVSETSREPEETTFSRLVDDLVVVLDVMKISKVFLVAKGFGVQIASLFALSYQEKVSGITKFGPPFIPGASFLESLPAGCYLSRWKEPNNAEADFCRFDAKTVVRKIYILFSQNEIPEASHNGKVLDLVDESSILPSWITEDDVAFYGTWYEKSGFHTALKVPYRSLDEKINIENPRIEVSALMIIGGRDHFLKLPPLDDYIKGGDVKGFVANLETTHLPGGTHFVQEQHPKEVNEVILNFIHKYMQYD